MKTARKLAKNPVFALLLTGLTLFSTSCSKQQVSNPATVNQTIEMTGEQMFREIMLIDGENIESRIPQYAEGVQSIENLTKEQNEVRIEFINEIVASINKLDPNYFTHFKSTINSGDLYLIREEMAKASKIIQSSIMSSEKYGAYISQATAIAEASQSEYDFSNPAEVDAFAENIETQLLENNAELSQRTIVALAAVVVVAVVVWEAAAFVNVAAVATVAAWAWAVVESAHHGGKGDLRGDDVVVAVSTNYRAR